MTARRNHGMTNPAKSLTNPPIPLGTPTSRRHPPGSADVSSAPSWERRRLVGTLGNADVPVGMTNGNTTKNPERRLAVASLTGRRDVGVPRCRRGRRRSRRRRRPQVPTGTSALPGRSRGLENQKRLFHVSLRPSSTQRILNQRENCERKPVDSPYSSRQEPRPSRGGYRRLRSKRRARA